MGYVIYQVALGTTLVCAIHRVDTQVVPGTTFGCNLHRVDTRVVPGTTVLTIIKSSKCTKFSAIQSFSIQILWFWMHSMALFYFYRNTNCQIFSPLRYSSVLLFLSICTGIANFAITRSVVNAPNRFWTYSTTNSNVYIHSKSHNILWMCSFVIRCSLPFYSKELVFPYLSQFLTQFYAP